MIRELVFTSTYNEQENIETGNIDPQIIQVT